MSHGKSDDLVIATTHNTARFFVEHRQVAWVLLVATVLWGVFAYFRMPKRKDPVFPARTAVVICVWPGVAAETIEGLVTRKIEQKIAENSTVTKIESMVRTSVTVTSFDIDERIADTSAQFDDVKLRLDSLTDLPSGTQPIVFLKDFGETAALMLTVASPPVSGPELDLKARDVQRAIAELRGAAPDGGEAARPSSSRTRSRSPSASSSGRGGCWRSSSKSRASDKDVRVGMGAGFVAIDGDVPGRRRRRAQVRAAVHHRAPPRCRSSTPTSGRPWSSAIRPRARERLASVAGDKYTYRDLDRFTDLIQKSIQTIPAASKVERSGVLEQRIYLDYSQQRLAAYGLHPSALPMLFAARNTQFPGGVLEVGSKNIVIDPSGELTSEREIGDILAPRVPGVLPVHLRDVVDISRDYESPARFLNYYTSRDASGHWRRARAITIAIQMRQGQQIREFGKAIDDVLADVRSRLPPDLIIARTSDQPLQVSENIDVFMSSLNEAVVLVVLVALIGFWEWRSALLLALSIPITLALTAGFMSAVGLDLQQISIGALIVSLGLLVDDPVVANDAIKRELSSGHPRGVAAWLGPTKLGRAILFATITNIAAYVPLLLLSGDLGRFIYGPFPSCSACSLVASRIVSMTFVPLLAYYLLEPSGTPGQPADRRRGMAGRYAETVRWALRHRWLALGASALVIGARFRRVHTHQDRLLPQGSLVPVLPRRLAADRRAAVGDQPGRGAGRAGRAEGGRRLRRRPSRARTASRGAILASVDELRGRRRAALLVLGRAGGAAAQLRAGAHPGAATSTTPRACSRCSSTRCRRQIAGRPRRRAPARNGQARRHPRVGPDFGRRHRRAPPAGRAGQGDLPRHSDRHGRARRLGRRDLHGEAEGRPGARQRRRRLQPRRRRRVGLDDERRAADDHCARATRRFRWFCACAWKTARRSPTCRACSSRRCRAAAARCCGRCRASSTAPKPRRFAGATSSGRSRWPRFPAPGTLPSEVMNLARPALLRFASTLPPGYKMVIGGAEEEQNKGFGEMSVIMAISVALIFLALVIQFNHAFKPIIVFATIPFGVVGALVALAIMGRPFGFNAFLGVASLIGVIVSHVIVLFDFIEEMHDRGRAARGRARRRGHRPPASGARHRGRDRVRPDSHWRCTAVRSGRRCATRRSAG